MRPTRAEPAATAAESGYEVGWVRNAKPYCSNITLAVIERRYVRQPTASGFAAGGSYRINNWRMRIRGERAYYLHVGAALGICCIDDAKLRFFTSNQGERYADMGRHHKFWRDGFPRAKLFQRLLGVLTDLAPNAIVRFGSSSMMHVRNRPRTLHHQTCS
jgi:hypothetical protein